MIISTNIRTELDVKSFNAVQQQLTSKLFQFKPKVVNG